MAILVIGGRGPRLMRRLIDRSETVVCMDLCPPPVVLEVLNDVRREEALPLIHV